MIPTKTDYYRRRAMEHRQLANKANSSKSRAEHEQIAGAYARLAKRYRLQQIFIVKQAQALA